MSKTAEIIRLTGVILLSLLLLGIVCFVAFNAQQLIFNQPTPVPHAQNLPAIHTENSFETASSLRRQYELHLEKSIQTALEKITGPRSVQATVHAEFNLLQETDESALLLPNTSVIRSTTVAENGTDDTGSDLYEQTTEYDFSTQKITRNNTFEQIKKLSVTVLIDGTIGKNKLYHPRSEREMQTYTALIQSITGFNAARGDVLEVINLPFSEPVPFYKNLPAPMLFSAIVLGVLILLSILILLYFIRPMMKQLMTTAPIPTLPTQPTLKPSTDKTPLGKAHNLFLQNPSRSVQLLRSWLSQPTDKLGETGLYRTSVLLLALGEDIIQNVFLRLSDAEMIEISRTMGTLGHIPAQTVQRIAEDFIKESAKSLDLTGTKETAQSVLEKTLPTDKADRLMKEINFPVAGKTVWDKLAHLPVSRLTAVFEKESPQVWATILYHLPDKKAGEILCALSTVKRDAVIESLTQAGPTDTDTLHTIETALEQQLQNMYESNTPSTGAEKLSGILSLLDKTAEDEFLKPLYTKSPQTAQSVHNQIMTFEQLATWDDESVKTLLRAASKETVVLALKGASDNIKDTFSRNMSPRVWADLMKEVAHLGAVRIHQIDAAQLNLLTLAQELKANHKIILKD